MQKIFLFLILTLASISAPADYYLEGLAGITQQESEQLDSTSFGFRAGYQFGFFYAIELGYLDYGEQELSVSQGFVSGTEIGTAFVELIDVTTFDETEAVSFGVKSMYPISSHILLVGRLGVSRWDTSGEFDGTNTIIEFLDAEEVGRETFTDSGSMSESGTSPYYGMGIQYERNGKFFLGIDYHVNEVEIFEQDVKTEIFALTAGFRFF